jgi:hypothetical protein
MADFVLKYADGRGQIHHQVATAASEKELRDKYAQQGFLIYSIKARSGGVHRHDRRCRRQACGGAVRGAGTGRGDHDRGDRDRDRGLSWDRPGTDRSRSGRAPAGAGTVQFTIALSRQNAPAPPGDGKK